MRTLKCTSSTILEQVLRICRCLESFFLRLSHFGLLVLSFSLLYAVRKFKKSVFFPRIRFADESNGICQAIYGAEIKTRTISWQLSILCLQTSFFIFKMSIWNGKKMQRARSMWVFEFVWSIKEKCRFVAKTNAVCCM